MKKAPVMPVSPMKGKVNNTESVEMRRQISEASNTSSQAQQMNFDDDSNSIVNCGDSDSDDGGTVLHKAR